MKPKLPDLKTHSPNLYLILPFNHMQGTARDTEKGSTLIKQALTECLLHVGHPIRL